MTPERTEKTDSHWSMADVSAKAVIRRVAIASGRIRIGRGRTSKPRIDDRRRSRAFSFV